MKGVIEELKQQKEENLDKIEELNTRVNLLNKKLQDVEKVEAKMLEEYQKAKAALKVNKKKKYLFAKK